MDRKEEIILTTLRLASANGLSGVSLGQVAESIGIKKASLYNHFASKEDLIKGMYEFLRKQAQANANVQTVDFSQLIKTKSANEILLGNAMSYIGMTKNEKLYLFYQLIYQERAIRKEAAQIVMEETKRMIRSITNLFYAFQVHGVMHFDNADIAALSYGMTMHSLIDFHFDSLQVDGGGKTDLIKEYIDWFCKQFKGAENEN